MVMLITLRQILYNDNMNSHFINLINYDCNASKQLLDLMTTNNVSPKAVQIMAHYLAGQQIWLNRCKGLPAVAGALWPGWTIDTFADLITANNKNWVEYIEGLNPEDFEKRIGYKNSKGNSFENKVIDILSHLINHGTHHRAQIGQQLKFAGVDELPMLDYIFYIRQKNQ
jgi:uncharacterized damage-inducible protein DinB